MNRAVEIIEEITPALKDRGLIFILGELIVDVLKLNSLCVVAVRYTADPVRPHPFIGDTVLCRFSFFVRAVGAGNGRFDLLLIGAGQLFPAALIRHKSYWSGRDAAWDGSQPL